MDGHTRWVGLSLVVPEVTFRERTQISVERVLQTEASSSFTQPRNVVIKRAHILPGSTSVEAHAARLQESRWLADGIAFRAEQFSSSAPR